MASLSWIWVFGGCGLGLGYVSPVSTLIRWFPDRRGMATGMAIMGFGGGAMIGAPLKAYLLKLFYEAPEYLGSVDSVNVITEGGRRFVETASQKIEVVVANASEASARLFQVILEFMWLELVIQVPKVHF